MTLLPDDAIVVRGGQNWPENFVNGSGVTIRPDGTLEEISVNAAAGLSVAELTASDPLTGYPGILNNQVGVSTVGQIRAQGGDVVPSPRRGNPNHVTLGGLTAEQASRLFRPTVLNPNRRKKS
jgi:hypothetical protein